MNSKEFNKGIWNVVINLRDFVTKNITPYHGTYQFLVGPSEKTQKLWDACKEATKEERGEEEKRRRNGT